jgi:molybdopterin-biosynthesis enzyme MoeA-like protein
MARTVSAAVILIGDELLSGRTQDSNLKTIAEFLNPLGVEVREARVIADVHDTIVATVQHLRKTYDTSLRLEASGQRTMTLRPTPWPQPSGAR